MNRRILASIAALLTVALWPLGALGVVLVYVGKSCCNFADAAWEVALYAKEAAAKERRRKRR